MPVGDIPNKRNYFCQYCGIVLNECFNIQICLFIDSRDLTKINILTERTNDKVAQIEQQFIVRNPAMWS